MFFRNTDAQCYTRERPGWRNLHSRKTWHANAQTNERTEYLFHFLPALAFIISLTKQIVDWCLLGLFAFVFCRLRDCSMALCQFCLVRGYLLPECSASVSGPDVVQGCFWVWRLLSNVYNKWQALFFFKVHKLLRGKKKICLTYHTCVTIALISAFSALLLVLSSLCVWMWNGCIHSLNNKITIL